MEIVYISSNDLAPDGATSFKLREKQGGFIFSLERNGLTFDSPPYPDQSLALAAAIERARELGIGKMYRIMPN